MPSEHSRISLEAELILCCARLHLDADALARLRILLRQELDWESLIQTALDHGVMPLLYSSLSTHCPESVPKNSMERLRAKYRDNVQRSYFSAAELLKVMSLFETHGINAISFKGPVLAAAVYRDLSLRQFSDLDILVHKHNLLEAGQLLASKGYQSFGGDIDDLEHDHEEVAYLEPNHYAFVEPRRQIRIDLQWRVTQTYFSFSLEGDRLWNRLVPVSIAGKTVPTFAPMDLLLILSVHGSKHRWEKLKWICDVAELVRVYQEEIDWAKIQQEASRLDIERMLRLGLFLAQDFLGAVLPEEIARKVQADSRTKSIARHIREKLFAREANASRDFEQVVFYLKTTDRWQDRSRFCFRYLSQFLRTMLTPTAKERAALPLPVPFFFLYYFLRPLRLTIKYGRLGLRRIYKEPDRA
jgi:hypothetical protein